ncbi:MAG: response regulator, partial [Pleurocapsa sp.]
TPVSSAHEALLTLNKLSPDLIISDIGMPVVNGYTLMAHIRKLPQGRNIPAIALTAYAGEDNRQRSLDTGFQHHLSKPINIPQLLETIAQLSNQ